MISHCQVWYYGIMKKSQGTKALALFLLEINMARDFAKAFYNSKEWRVVREYILMRDKYLCTNCGNPAEEVHHIIHLTPENITDINISLNAENLTSLCKDCHFGIHRIDKVNGIKKSHNSFSCGNEYEFDENGYLIQKSPL